MPDDRPPAPPDATSPASTASPARHAGSAHPSAVRHLVLCLDGTNNTLTGGAKDTNVLRLVAHLAQHPSPQRLVYYDPGVGTPDTVPPTDPVDWARRSWDRLSGLASGRGVHDNVAQAYLFLMQHWRGEHDRICLFGFSRGAFTARAVAGMVNLFGILRPEHEALLPTLIRVYFSPPGGHGGWLQRGFHWMHDDGSADPAQDPREQTAEQVRRLFAQPLGQQPWVHWVGVWDTVESVGLPGPLSARNPSTATLCGKRMRHVRHALALDEHRYTFLPRLYEEPGDIDDPATGQSLRQRWFAGVHCDVGGSYPQQHSGLADEALAWMVDELAAELQVPPMPPPDRPRMRHDALWDTPWWALAGMSLRDLRPRSATGEAIAVIAAPVRDAPADTVWARRRALWPLLLALALGFVCLVMSGLRIRGASVGSLASLQGVQAALLASVQMAQDQLATLWRGGLLQHWRLPWHRTGHPAWAMAWDLGFIACWGYLLARATSRAFAWLAGARRPGDGLPAWRWLGMAPLLAVGGDVAEDLLLVAALAVHGIGLDAGARFTLWLGAWGSVAKFAGLIACVPLLLVWLGIHLSGGPARRPLRRRG